MWATPAITRRLTRHGNRRSRIGSKRWIAGPSWVSPTAMSCARLINALPHEHRLRAGGQGRHVPGTHPDSGFSANPAKERATDPAEKKPRAGSNRASMPASEPPCICGELPPEVRQLRVYLAQQPIFPPGTILAWPESAPGINLHELRLAGDDAYLKSFASPLHEGWARIRNSHTGDARFRRSMIAMGYPGSAMSPRLRLKA